MLFFCSYNNDQVEGQIFYVFYNEVCPKVEKILLEMVFNLSITDSTTPALLRLIFHDCQVQVHFFHFLTHDDFIIYTKYIFKIVLVSVKMNA